MHNSYCSSVMGAPNSASWVSSPLTHFQITFFFFGLFASLITEKPFAAATRQSGFGSPVERHEPSAGRHRSYVQGLPSLQSTGGVVQLPALQASGAVHRSP